MKFTFWICLACAAVLGAGCLSPKEDHSRFYTLSSGGSAELGGAAPVGMGEYPLLFVSPVSLPRYLDRPAMVTRVGEVELVYSDEHFWAEPLSEGVTRRIREALAASLGVDRVHAAEVRRPAEAYLDLQVNIGRFEVDAAGEAVLVARWVMGMQPRGGTPLMGEGTYRRRVVPGDFLQGARVAALAGCIDDLVEAIVTRLSEPGAVSED